MSPASPPPAPPFPLPKCTCRRLGRHDDRVRAIRYLAKDFIADPQRPKGGERGLVFGNVPSTGRSGSRAGKRDRERNASRNDLEKHLKQLRLQHRAVLTPTAPSRRAPPAAPAQTLSTPRVLAAIRAKVDPRRNASATVFSKHPPRPLKPYGREYGARGAGPVRHGPLGWPDDRCLIGPAEQAGCLASFRIGRAERGPPRAQTWPLAVRIIDQILRAALPSREEAAMPMDERTPMRNSPAATAFGVSLPGVPVRVSQLCAGVGMSPPKVWRGWPELKAYRGLRPFSPARH